jgi:Fic family protein
MVDITQNYHRGNPESVKAHRRSRLNAERDRTRILRLVGARGAEGLTCDEAERLLGLSHQTCSARFSELKRDKLLAPTGTLRPTRSGAKARVMVIHE